MINDRVFYGCLNSTIITEKNSKLEQNCKGIGIFANKNCKLFLYKGEISNNFAINSGKIFIKTPKNDRQNKISTINSCIYGSAIFVANNSEFQMENDFIIKDNICELNSEINVEENSIVNEINSIIKGGQIHFNKSMICIKGGVIENGKNTLNNKKTIVCHDNKYNDSNKGGALSFVNCSNIQMDNIKISKCNSDKGGGIFLFNSTGKISNSSFEKNLAKTFGGAIFINQNSQIELINNNIINNRSEMGSGGGIYSQGNITIDGKDSLISDNIAENYGGGMFVKNDCKIINGKISHNKAIYKSGGGIFVDGSLEIIGGKICKNWANLNGGGINYESAKKFIYNSSGVKIYKNQANNSGDDIFPLKE